MRQLEDPQKHGADTRKVVEDFRSYLGIFKRGWRLIAIGVLLALIASVVYFAWLNPSYRASTRLLLIQQGGRPMQAGGGSDPYQASGSEPNEILATHLLILKSPLIAEKAIELEKLRSISIASLVRGLKVNLPDPSAKVIDLSFASATPEEARRVVDGVVMSFDRFLKDNFQEHSSKVITLFTTAKDDLSKELKQLETEYLSYRRANPAYSADEKGRSFLVRRLDQWDQAMNQVLTRSLQLKSQLELGRKLANEGADSSSIANALNQLSVVGGSGVVTTMAPPGPAEPREHGFSIAKLNDELASLEIQRKTAQTLLDNLRAEQERTVPTGPELDHALSSAFYADADVAELQAALVDAKTQVESVRRIARLGGDPTVVAARKRVQTLERELFRLWQERRPTLAKSLKHSNGELATAIEKAEGELMTLRARESALRDQLGSMVADRVEGLHREHAELKKRFGDKHPQVQQLLDQIAKLEGQADRQPNLREDEKTAAMLASITESLKSIESLRTDLQTRFEHDLNASKQTEITQLEENNLRSNLERQRTLFNSMVDQLKQAQLASDFGSVSTQAISPTTVAAERPNLALIILFAIFAGGGLGGVAAFLADFLDARVRTVSEVRRLLDMSLIGIVPELSAGEAESVKSVGLVTQKIRARPSPRHTRPRGPRWNRSAEPGKRGC